MARRSSCHPLHQQTLAETERTLAPTTRTPAPPATIWPAIKATKDLKDHPQRSSFRHDLNMDVPQSHALTASPHPREERTPYKCQPIYLSPSPVLLLVASPRNLARDELRAEAILEQNSGTYPRA